MPGVSGSLYGFGEFRLDGQNRLLQRGEAQIPLTPKALELLLLLVQRAGEVVGKDDLMKALWPDSFVEESNLTQTVFMLRRALGESPQRRYILTVQGRGYRFIAEVKTLSSNGDGPSGALAAAAPTGALAGAQTRTAKLRIQFPSRFWLFGTAALCLVLATGLFAYFRLSGPRYQTHAARARSMLAVLPFQNLTGDASQEYFSDGLTEEMISHLGNLDPQHLGVIARTSVMHYKTNPAPPDQIGRELGVQYVIEGSVRRDSDQIRVTAQLIETKGQTHVWARQYDRELQGVLTLQSEIAREIADEIRFTLGDRKSYAPEPVVSSSDYEAYELYLKGQYFLNKRTPSDLRAAIGYFQQAAGIDPNYARAYAGLAGSFALCAVYSTEPQTETMSKARHAALKALSIDERLPEAHTALGLIVQEHDWDWGTAEREFRRAIELNPNYSTAHHWYAEHLMWRGRFDEALQESERARQLDPLSLIVAADNGAILYFSRQYDRAIEKWNSVREMDPAFLRTHLIMGAYVEKGMFAEALTDNDWLRAEVAAPSYWSWRAYIRGRAGQTADGRRALHELLQLDRSRPIDPMVIAQAYVGLGDKEQALGWLEKAYVQHSAELISLKVNPGFDPLRGDPRFQDLLRRVGLAD
jgi:TolB-like protein/DNA-binding winged helix-turn-helix (wHTH) protein